MRTQTKEIQENLSCKDAHKILVEGNNRFVQNLKVQRNLQEQVLATSQGQFPFATVLSCIDSRVPAELIFDQGIGDIFSVRIAGNIVNEDILGSMEFACDVGAKIVVIMGHTKCGAINAACNDVERGNITGLLSKIKPAVDYIRKGNEKMSDAAIAEVGIQNVKVSIDRIRAESTILADLENTGQIEIVAALYDITSGQVTFFEDPS